MMGTFNSANVSLELCLYYSEKSTHHINKTFEVNMCKTDTKEYNIIELKNLKG